MKILITNTSSFTVGDIAICNGIIDQLRSKMDSLEIVIESANPKEHQHFIHDKAIRLVPRLFNAKDISPTRSITSPVFLLKNSRVLTGYLVDAFALLVYKYFGRNPFNKAVIREFNSADAIIAAGSDALTQTYGYFLRLFTFNVLKRRRKTVILYASTVGPFKGRLTGYVKRSLQQIDLILARDRMSYDYLHDIGVAPQRLHLTADCVIPLRMLNTRKGRQCVKDLGITNQAVGIFLKTNAFSTVGDRDYLSYLAEIAKLVRHLTKERSRVIFLSANRTDSMTTSDFMAQNGFDLPIINALDYDPGEFKWALSHFGLVVTSRMHPAILASTAGVPVIGVSNESKMKEYLKIVGLGEYHLQQSSFKCKVAGAMIDSLIGDSSIRDNLKLLTGRAEKLALTSADIVADYLTPQNPYAPSSQHKPKVSIVVLNWNSRKWLKRCLDSLLDQSYANIEIIVVDNASSDDSAEFLDASYGHRIIIVRSAINLGFAAGNNLGIQHATGELLMLFNNDAWAKPDLVHSLVSYMQQHTNIGVVGPFEPKYEPGTEKEQYRKIDPLGHPINSKAPVKPFFLSGVCILFSKKLYTRSLGLDGNFFMYFEEVDWFWRLKLMGIGIANVPGQYVYHHGAGSTGKGIKVNSFLWRNQNSLQMLIKNYRLYNLLWVLPLYAAQNMIEAIVFTLALKPKIAITYPMGWWFNIVHLPRTLHQRRMAQSLRIVPEKQIFLDMYHGFAKMNHLVHYIRSVQK